jgi:hypothetical protein
MANTQSTLPNDEKKSQDSKYNPSEYSDREKAGNTESIPGYDRSVDGLDDHPISAGDASGIDPQNIVAGAAVRSAEEKGGWISSYGGNTSNDRQGITWANFRSIARKRGPIAAIITLLLGGGIGAGIFFGPSLLLVQIQESFLKTFDTQNTSLTIRTNKILVNKLVDGATTGSCDVIKVACRFSRPSNKLLKNLERNGVLARDKNNDIISRKDGLFQTRRPAIYTFQGEDIPAKDFAKALRTNAAFRAAFHTSYNPRFVGFTDAVFKKIQGRFGFDTSNKDAAAGDKKTAERLNESSKGTNAVVGETVDGGEGIIKNLLKTKVGEVVGKIAKGGKGDGFGLVAASVCTIGDIPKLIISTIRAYQLVQVVNYSMQFLVAGSALKAGQITQEQSAALGALLTTSVANKTAMDSFGIKYSLFGDSRASNNSYEKFIPGGSAVTSLGGVAQVLSSDAKKNTCDFATNPATGAAVNVGLAAAGPETLGTSLLVAGVNILAGFAISDVVTKVGVPLIQQALQGVDVKPLLGFFLGDLTQNLAGEDVGNALASGASNMMAQTANAGGNMPLTVDQAVAYNQSTQSVNIAYAQEDRVTLSPLDPTNPNTIVGGIVGKLIPFFASINSVGSALSSIVSIPSDSLAMIIHGSETNALTAQQYSLCNDPGITDQGIAAGPFCNVQYGIPTQYLDMDPQQIVDDLVASGDVNPDSGEAIDKGDGTGLNQWIGMCTDGSTEELKNCQITDQKTAEYSLYIIDHRIQQSMDDQTTVASTNISLSEVRSLGYIPTTTSTYVAALNNLLDTTSPIQSSAQKSSVLSESPVITTKPFKLIDANEPYVPSLRRGWYWSVV